MSENQLDLDLSNATVATHCGQCFVVSGQFLQELKQARLNLSDLKPIFESVHRTLMMRGWWTPHPGVCFAVTEAVGCNYLIGYAPVAPFQFLDVHVTGLVLLSSCQFEQEIAKVRTAFAHLEKKQRRKFFSQCLRAEIGVKLAHELAHAWATNTTCDCFKNLPTEELELLTDAVALLSCIELFGSDAYLGVPYIQKKLKEQGETVAHDTAVRLARSIITAFPITVPSSRTRLPLCEQLP